MVYELFLFFFPSPGVATATTSTKMTLERAASHLKVTHPPCLFQLPPWENVNR